MCGVVTIGDCIIDEVRAAGQPARRYAGGAGLNLAAGIARLGLPSVLVTRLGQDRDGFWLLRYARDRGVRVVNTPGVDPTGIAISTREAGEPSYAFAPAMYRRRIAFPPPALAALAAAGAVVVNSHPLDNPAEVDLLVAALQAAPGLRIVDPNPRPRLVAAMPAYRQGFERALAVAQMAKLSDEDVQHLYGTDWTGIAPRLFGLGVGTILFSHGAGGATLLGRDGLRLHVPVADHPGPVIDTMGAGDATLASLVASVLREGWPALAADWQRHLAQAMRVAAATCRQPGAELVPAWTPGAEPVITPSRQGTDGETG